MRSLQFPAQALLLLAVGAILVALHADTLWSQSVDLAHHYALVFRLTENWAFAPNDPSLGEMNIYPRLGHTLAAGAGLLADSPFMGLHLVALGALALVWASFLLILYAAPGRSGMLAALVLALLMWVNHGAVRIHGTELSHDYHFAQLLAQALAVLAIACAIRIEARLPKAAVYVFLLAAIGLIIQAHLLPALELLGVLAGLALLDTWKAPREERGGAAVRALVAVAAGIALIVLHPTFATMREISQHNGGLSLGPLGKIWAIGIVCLLVLASAASLLRTWHGDPQRYRMYKYLALYGAAIAGLCLLQMALRYAGLGSDYAVKKYAAGLCSFLFVRIALWAGAAAERRLAARPVLARALDRPAVAFLILALALTPAMRIKQRPADRLDVPAVVAAEGQVAALRGTVLSTPAPDRSNVVVDLDGLPSVISYMLSIGVAHAPRNVAWLEMTGATLGPLERYGLIVTSRNAARFAGRAHCSTIAGGPLLVLDAACLHQAPLAAQEPRP